MASDLIKIPKDGNNALSIATLITAFVVSYYILGSYKFYLEINKLKKENGNNQQ